LVLSDFSPAGGPSALNGALTYTCGNATLGSSCTGVQIAGSAQTPVVSIAGGSCTGGGGACSSTNPNTVQVFFTLDDVPGYQTGAYAAKLLFVISAI
jgi:hypothetical protein